MSHPQFLKTVEKSFLQPKREKQEHLTRSNAPVFPVLAVEKIFLQFLKIGDDSCTKGFYSSIKVWNGSSVLVIESCPGNYACARFRDYQKPAPGIPVLRLHLCP